MRRSAWGDKPPCILLDSLECALFQTYVTTSVATKGSQVSVVGSRPEPKTKRELRDMIAKSINVRVVEVAVYRCKSHGWDANVTNQAVKQITSELREKYYLVD